MKVMIACSTAFYDKVGPIKEQLEKNNHQIITPNGYDEPGFDDDTSKMTEKEYSYDKENGLDKTLDFFKRNIYNILIFVISIVNIFYLKFTKLITI